MKKTQGFQLIKTLSVVLIAILLNYCATSPKDNFKNLEVGMEKVDVIELLGSPRDNWKKDEKEFWRYSFYEGHNETIKEVVFSHGKVITFGQPAISQEQEIEAIQSMDELKMKAKKEIDQPTYDEP